MVKRFVLLAAILLGWIALAIPVSAQSTPTVGGGGQPATIYDANGQPTGTIAVTNLVDPFTAFDRLSSPPQRGFHWAMATISYTAGAAQIDISSSSFYMVDADGFINYAGYVSRNEASTSETPDFDPSQASPNQTVTGAIFFQVFQDSPPAWIAFSPSSQQSTIIADYRDQPVTPGTVVDVAGSDANPYAAVKVDGVVDPQAGFDPQSPPQRGFHFVSVSITITNTGDQPLSVDPGRFWIVDHQGFVTNYYSISRTQESTAGNPDFAYGTIDPGASASGLVHYQMIDGSSIAAVVYAPAGNRAIRIADYAEGAAFVPPAASPVAEPTPTATTAPADPACADAVTWANAATTALAPVADVFDLVGKASNGEAVDAAQAHAGATQLRQAADTLAAGDTPEIVAAVSAQYVDALKQMADALDTLGDHAAAGDTAATTADANAIYTIAFGLTGGAYTDLVAKCPAIQEVD